MSGPSAAAAAHGMTDAEFVAEIDRRIAEDRKTWPTIDDMPAWHPVRKLRDQIEADVTREARR
jgi:hypothetical protein